MKPLPRWGMRLITASSALYIGLAVCGWGGWSAFLAHPARAGAVAAIAVISVAAMFTSGNTSSGRREDTKNRWILPSLVLGFVLAWLPAYNDRRDIGTTDGDAARHLGLALFVAGNVFRVGAVFVLGRRSSGLVAIQEGHGLMTGGLYRVIRHPSNLGRGVAGRRDERRASEMGVRCRALDIMTHQGMPVTVRVA